MSYGCGEECVLTEEWQHGKGAKGRDPGVWGVLGHPAGHSVELKAGYGQVGLLPKARTLWPSFFKGF